MVEDREPEGGERGRDGPGGEADEQGLEDVLEEDAADARAERPADRGLRAARTELGVEEARARFSATAPSKTAEKSAKRYVLQRRTRSHR